MGDVDHTVPYKERPEKFLIFPWSVPQKVWLPGKHFEWRWKKLLRVAGREYIAEYFGTLIFITFAIGGAAQAFYSGLKETGWIGGDGVGLLESSLVCTRVWVFRRTF